MASVPPTKPDRTGPFEPPGEKPPIAEPVVPDPPETEPATPDFGEPGVSPDDEPADIDRPGPVTPARDTP